MVRFVVWGAGDRGHIAAEIFGADRIVAFIDSDPAKAGSLFYGKPVIDFSSYKSEYSEYAILISLAQEQSITELLTKEDLFFFTIMNALQNWSDMDGSAPESMLTGFT